MRLEFDCRIAGRRRRYDQLVEKRSLHFKTTRPGTARPCPSVWAMNLWHTLNEAKDNAILIRISSAATAMQAEIQRR